MKVLFITLAASAGALPVEDVNATRRPHGYWCAGAPVDPKAPVAHHTGASFRGQFQDLSLWVEDTTHTLHNCEVIEPHHSGNDGLWVIEFDTDDMMRREKAKIWVAGLKVMAERARTLVVAGGEKVPNALQYDACGMEKDLRIISVSDHAVRGPRPMSHEEKEKYMKLAKERLAGVEEVLGAVERDSILGFIGHFQSYQTRNSYSGDNGLNQAVRCITLEPSSALCRNAPRAT
jgi:hypothetical protein